MSTTTQDQEAAIEQYHEPWLIRAAFQQSSNKAIIFSHNENNRRQILRDMRRLSIHKHTHKYRCICVKICAAGRLKQMKLIAISQWFPRVTHIEFASARVFFRPVLDILSVVIALHFQYCFGDSMVLSCLHKCGHWPGNAYWTYSNNKRS